MPNIGSGDSKVALLLYMHSGVPLEPRIYIRGKYRHNNYPTHSTIDWGDGQTVIVQESNQVMQSISFHSTMYTDMRIYQRVVNLPMKEELQAGTYTDR